MRKLLFIFLLTCFSTAGYSVDVQKFRVFESSFTYNHSSSNPVKDIKAFVTFTSPSNSTAKAMMFWDGGSTFKVRFAPTETGTWTYKTTSSISALNGQTGSFNCTSSSYKGGIKAMPGYTTHFCYEDGTPMFFLGDTQWEATVNNPETGLSKAAMNHYFDVRAQMGINSVHCTINRGSSNEGGVCFPNGVSNALNPGYFQEADSRFQYANNLGITIGIALAKGAEISGIFNTDLNLFVPFAQYVVARYGAYNVYFLQGMEYQISGAPESFWNAAGIAMDTINANRRLIGSHADGNKSSRSLAKYSWCTFGDFMQYQSASAQHAQALLSKATNKPVVNGECGYWAKAPGETGYVATVEGMRNVGFNVMMAGSYVATGFGSTYLGGRRSPDLLFEVDKPVNDIWEEQFSYFKKLFTSTEWWKLTPSDASITGSATQKYCLANTGNEYIVYVLGSTSAMSLNLGTSTSTTYTIKRFSPVTGLFTDLSNYTGVGPITLTNPDSKDYAYVIKKDVPVGPNPLITSPLTSVKFSPGASVTANGSGVNLSWKVSSLAAGTIKTGTGASITFTVPLTAADNSKIKVELTGGTAGNEVVFNEYTVLDDLPVISTALSQSSIVNQAISLQLAATGNGTPFTWSSTTLPSGLSLSTGGLLTGTLTTVGTSTFSVSVTDADGDTDTETISYTVTDVPEITDYECEEYTSQSGCSKATTYTGFTGTGFVDMGGIDTWFELNNVTSAVTGNATLTIKYMNGGALARPASISVNGVVVASNNFITTGGWGTWGTVTISNIPLVAGNNIIRITATTSAGGANYDNFSIEQTGTTISELSASNLLAVYPNPAKDLICISNPSLCDQLIIYDILSREQINAKVNGDGQIDISSLSANLYMIRLLKNDKVLLSQKLIKN